MALACGEVLPDEPRRRRGGGGGGGAPEEEGPRAAGEPGCLSLRGNGPAMAGRLTACRLTAAARAGRGRGLLLAVRPGAWRWGRRHRSGRAGQAAGLAAAAAGRGGDDGSGWRLVGEYGLETEEKKSRFLALASPVSTSEEAVEWIRARSDLSASHNCWAYRVSRDEYLFSDDGEPGGTAGQPILRAIEGKGVVDVAVLVIRSVLPAARTGGCCRARELGRRTDCTVQVLW